MDPAAAMEPEWCPVKHSPEEEVQEETAGVVTLKHNCLTDSCPVKHLAEGENGPTDSCPVKHLAEGEEEQQTAEVQGERTLPTAAPASVRADSGGGERALPKKRRRARGRKARATSRLASPRPSPRPVRPPPL